MAKYEVDFIVKVGVVREIEADSKEQAEELAREKLGSDDKFWDGVIAELSDERLLIADLSDFDIEVF